MLHQSPYQGTQKFIFIKKSWYCLFKKLNKTLRKEAETRIETTLAGSNWGLSCMEKFGFLTIEEGWEWRTKSQVVFAFWTSKETEPGLFQLWLILHEKEEGWEWRTKTTLDSDVTERPRMYQSRTSFSSTVFFVPQTLCPSTMSPSMYRLFPWRL